jgi:hypothetical protein
MEQRGLQAEGRCAALGGVASALHCTALFSAWCRLCDACAVTHRVQHRVKVEQGLGCVRGCDPYHLTLDVSRCQSQWPLCVVVCVAAFVWWGLMSTNVKTHTQHKTLC